jgi:hypothetical protein
MTLRARLAKLERNRPEPFAASALELDLPPDLCARIGEAQAAGTFPQSLADADLEAIVAAGDVTRGHA